MGGWERVGGEGGRWVGSAQFEVLDQLERGCLSNLSQCHILEGEWWEALLTAHAAGSAAGSGTVIV